MIISSIGWYMVIERPDMVGRKHSVETRRLISKNGKGKKKTSGKPVPIIQYRYEVVKVPIAEYSSAAEASKQTGISAGDIRSVVRGEQFTAGGFMWGEK